MSNRNISLSGPPIDPMAQSRVARKDSVEPKTPGRLERHTITDEYSGARRYEYSGDKSVWMDQFKSPGFLQIKINNSSNIATPAEQARAISEYRVSHPNLEI